MQGKNILVIGASRGIGRAIAVKLLDLGAVVVVVARNEDRLNELVGEYPENAIAYRYDLNDLNNIEDIFSFCNSHNIVLDGMVYSAGIVSNTPIKNTSVSEMIEMMTVNYFAFVQVSRFFMKRKYSNSGASVVVVSSISADICDKALSQYSSSKAAVNAFVKTMSKEVERRYIRVNAVAPSLVDTDMINVGTKNLDNYNERMNKSQPWGVIPPEQIAELAEYLLSDASRYITGQVITISGPYNVN